MKPKKHYLDNWVDWVIISWLSIFALGLLYTILKPLLT